MSDLARIKSYVEDRWVDGQGAGSTLFDPSTEQPLATASTTGVDFGAALAHSRRVGGASLRALGFAARGAILKALSGLMREHRDELYALSAANGGNTLSDAKFDIDGAGATLAFYAGLAKSMGDGNVLADGEALPLGRTSPLAGRHVFTPRRGAALLINAYNFPAWGFAEKLACAFLAGMPVAVKPATATAMVAARIGELFVASGQLPPGSWTFLAGPAGDLLDHLEAQDVLAFTGSALTGRAMRGNATVLGKGVRVTVEADSLNSAVLGPDVVPGSPLFELAVAQIAHEMTQKAGQKCTAIRRVLVPSAQLDAVQQALIGKLAGVRVGDPRAAGTTMGPVTSASQRDDVRSGTCKLAAEASVVFGGAGTTLRHDGGDPGVGYFVPPVLLRAVDAHAAREIHEREVFGPVATLLPYDGSAGDAASLVARGEGSLVATLYADDGDFLDATLQGIAPFHGRVVVASNDVVAEALAPGMVLPGLIHGGPGRAGASEELGGARGLANFMQRTAIQGSRVVIDRLTGSGG
jgi:oxepin-CoA hydrolase/3-oxo-5,6-dehydrosuberyl-CoA semialdehyde dehydrogenase